MKNKLILKGYIGFSIIYLLITLFEFEKFAGYLKPFLIVFLLLAVYFSAKFDSKKILLSALLFSWIGDIILLFADRGEMYFIFGLIAFLLSHLIYIIVFRMQLGSNKPINKATYWSGVCVILIYFTSMIFTLFPKLGPLKIPVLVYAIVITTMLYFAFKGSLKWNNNAGNSVLLGALFFVSSDSILAFNKFYSPIPLNSFLIMATYIAAQYFIVNGILNLNEKK